MTSDDSDYGMDVPPWTMTSDGCDYGVDLLGPWCVMIVITELTTLDHEV